MSGWVGFWIGLGLALGLSDVGRGLAQLGERIADGLRRFSTGAKS